MVNVHNSVLHLQSILQRPRVVVVRATQSSLIDELTMCDAPRVRQLVSQLV